MNTSSGKTIDGLILAGGQSQRMGRDKATLLVRGETLLDYHCRIMAPVTRKLYIAAGHLSANPFTCSGNDNVYFLEDYFSGHAGPLSGLYSALQASDADYLWVQSCDNYGFDASLKNDLLAVMGDNQADVVYVESGARSHPLLALFKTSLAHSLLGYLQSGGRSVFKWYETLETKTLHLSYEPTVMANINTPEDFKALLVALDAAE